MEVDTNEIIQCLEENPLDQNSHVLDEETFSDLIVDSNFLNDLISESDSSSESHSSEGEQQLVIATGRSSQRTRTRKIRPPGRFRDSQMIRY